MKLLAAMLPLLLIDSFAGAAETDVDKLVRRLDESALTFIDDWKVSPDIARSRLDGDGYAAPGFDYSAWETLKIDQNLSVDSCWIRKRIVIPKFILGEPAEGPLRLLLTVDDYGFLWVNGESKGRFNWDGEFELTKNAKPGDVFEIAIKAINTGGPLRLMRASLAFKGQEFAEDAANLSLSLRVAQKLVSFDTYQTNATVKVDPGTDRSRVPAERRKKLGETLQRVAKTIDMDALDRGDKASFRKSLEKARKDMAPLREFAREFTLYFTANAHIDAAWLWREKETVQVCRNTFASVMNMFKARKGFTYSQSSAAYYEWMEQLYPELFKEMKEKIKEGRWEVTGGSWIEPDCNLISGTSWARQLLYGKRYLKEKVGTDVTLGWNPDSFGYNWNMPQFYREAGIDAFITQKIGWNDTNVFPHRVFWWQSPDGSRVLSYFPFDYVNTVDNPGRLVDWLRQFEANTGFRKMLVLFGVGDHGGGPSLEMIDRAEKLKTLDIFPSIEYGTARAHLDWLKTQPLEDLPVWNDELYLEYHQGTFTTQADTKKANRETETLLSNTEKFTTLATLAGGRKPGPELKEAWKDVLFNQFHDILPGSSIREVYIDAKKRYDQARESAGFQLGRALGTIAERIDTSRLTAGKPIAVFNPLAWERRDVVRLALPLGDELPCAVFDASGREVPSQVVVKGPLKREVLFIADKVPALGYSLYELRRQPPSAFPGPKAGDSWLENDALRVEIDPASGWVSSIKDKKTGREVLSGPGNRLQLLEDRPKAWDAWNIGWTGTEFPSAFRGAKVVETGPVRTVLRLERDYLKPGTKKTFPTEDFPNSFFTQDIALYAGSDRVDFTTDIDWWEEKTMLKVAFPVPVNAKSAAYEIPYGVISRSTGLTDTWDKA
ncbi:MAG TPA: glycoside hydrolase family 38 C-terminal domain-containing protein, partial [Elusimicrobiales bacterium]|nr:glycoside hydrolase family 38 C-terminal domain-containing protein [Elusimicrobiales bacterium]